MQIKNNNHHKRVLIIVENLPVPLDRRVWSEATALNEAGYEVFVICPKSNGFNKSREFINGIHIYRHYLPSEISNVFGYLREYSIALIMQLYLSIVIKINNGIDIIHICNPPDLLFLVAGFHKILFRTKVIFDHHDLNPEMYSEKFHKKDFFYKTLFFLEKMTFKLSDTVISTNESYREVALERGNKNKDNIFIVRSSPDINEYRNSIPFSTKKIDIVGYVGIIGETDGVENFVEVADYILKIYKNDILFKVVGDGPALLKVKELVNEKKIKSHFDFTGMITDKNELIKTISTFTVGIVPDEKTSYSDKCTMNKILEYMALSIPFVYFDLKESKRIAFDAGICVKSGDIIEMAKGIIKILNNPKLKTLMGRNGRKIMEQELNWDFQKKILIEAYKKTLN